MKIDERLNNILDTGAKVRIIRLFVSRTPDFMATGRQVAREIGLSAPATHAALKELHDLGVLTRDIVGRQHLYRIDNASRMVRDILRPAFEKEMSARDDITKFIARNIEKLGLGKEVRSVVLYGSVQKGAEHEESDCDIAVVVGDEQDRKRVEEIFSVNIAPAFKKYFNMNLDVYIKTVEELVKRLKNKLPPLSLKVGAYKLIYGKDLTEL